ncbi:hypothetical protein SDRG_02597 [Saprolegnia diclina VS20]|uniref:F-box domain-containing protein n=1 Tax=Saprolegnia diclina (strain VS20) TaxID=1156394 RepID=T0QZ22_SAPDV|nr:hypothetical protein SDRG_02597 [Saprolegnia diclina VS20]EQC39941.1 hypothetical protein SDRG_02597 [Saprolegnia diclina VS20]|eukprot:XP_008606415.1 hypothetical protein SDRG_02597 [Saprolegnia diclina VS20]
MGIVCSSTESVVESHDVRAPKHCRTKNPSQPQHRRRLPLGSSTLVELCLDRLAIEVASAPASVDTAVLPPELFGALLRRLVAHEALTADLFARLGESLPLGTRVDLTDCADVDTGWLQALAPSITASLMHIDLTRCTGVETLGREPLAALRVAKLSHCKNMSPLALHPLSNATHLSVLHLAGCALLRNESLGHLLSCTQLTDLDLSQCPSISDTGLFALPPSLRRLNLSQCSGISDRGVLAVVTGLASLLSLNLGLCNITNGALAMLAVHAHQLQHLVLSGCRAVDQAGVNLLDSLSELVSFEASQCRLVQSPHRAWASLTFLDLSTSGVNDTGLAVTASLETLTSLDVSQSQATATSFRCLRSLSRLRYFKAARTKLNDATFQVLCEHLTSLEELHVAHTDVSDMGARGLPHLKHLTSLVLSTEGVTYHSLSSVGSLHQLTSLALFGASIADRGLEYLACLQSLRRLVLCSGYLTDRGAGMLASSAPHLTELNVSHNKELRDAGLKCLAQLRQLKTLNVSNTSIDAASLVHLQPLQHLETLLAYGLVLTRKEFAAFKDAMPSLCLFRCSH